MAVVLAGYLSAHHVIDSGGTLERHIRVELAAIGPDTVPELALDIGEIDGRDEVMPGHY